MMKKLFFILTAIFAASCKARVTSDDIVNLANYNKQILTKSDDK